MYEEAFFGGLAAYFTYQQQYFTALAFVICLGVCTFLSNYPLDKNDLPTCKEFLKLVTLDYSQHPEDAECPVCYDATQASARLTCGHQLCQDCVKHVFVPENHRCPMCRVPLFRAKAPWDSFRIKIIACTALLSLIQTFLTVALIALQHEEIEHSWWNDFVMVFEYGGLILEASVLLVMWSFMDHDGLSFWRVMKHWSTSPVFVWSLWSLPIQAVCIQEAVMEIQRLCGNAGS